MLSCCLLVYCMMKPLTAFLSTFLSLYFVSLPLFSNPLFPHTLLPSLSVSSHLFLSFHLSPFPPFFSLSGSMIGDFKLPQNFIIKPYFALTALVASCQTHKDMQAHTQAHTNMPPETIILGNHPQIHVKNN